MQDGKYVVEVKNGTVVGEAVSYETAVNAPAVPLKSYTALYVGGGIIVGLLLFILLSVKTVKHQNIKVIQRFGKFKKLMSAGLNFRVPLIDHVAGTLDLRVQQMIFEVETKTKDNVFVRVPVAVQFNVVPEKAETAFYKLRDPNKQIMAYVFDNVRASVPTFTLDEVFEKKSDIANKVRDELKTTMDDFGYNIVTALITDIDPDSKVKDSMNEINASKRLREAATEKAEAAKVTTVKAAEAEAAGMKLQGEGVAQQRMAIADGLKKAAEALADVPGIDRGEIMNTIMLTQYLDTMKELGKGQSKIIFVNSGPSGMSDLAEQIKVAMIGAGESVK